jgi:tRNA threonylcarbamoyladenosine biosynthesis protein TsaB
VLVLALDTTTSAGSVALVRDRDVIVVQAGDPSLTHAQRLPRDLMRGLDTAGVRLDDVELFAVAAGPGSFTGLRVGIATVQGLAMAAGRKVVAVSALDALARAGRQNNRHTAAWMDAQRGQVFAALYDPSGTLAIEPSSLPPARTLDEWDVVPDGTRFIGDGAVRYRDAIASRLPAADVVTDVPLLAGTIGLIAAAHPERAVLPHAIVPIYIRRPDAELARARQE